DAEALAARIAAGQSARVTPLMFQEDLIHSARVTRRRIVLPEGTEDRILRAAEILRQRDVADLTLLGNPDEVKEKIAALGLTLDGIEILDPATSELLDDFGATYHELRKHKGITPEAAREAMTDVSAF